MLSGKIFGQLSYIENIEEERFFTSTTMKIKKDYVIVLLKIL